MPQRGKRRIATHPFMALLQTWEPPMPIDCSFAGSIGMEKIMTRLAWIGLAAALLLGGATFAMAQNGPATGGYPPATKNPNLYGYYGYHHRYYAYYPRYHRYHHRYWYRY